MGRPSHLAIRKFQSTLPVRGATASYLCITYCQRISIHAPREGSDVEIETRIAV